jgi:hypothetical protein
LYLPKGETNLAVICFAKPEVHLFYAAEIAYEKEDQCP